MGIERRGNDGGEAAIGYEVKMKIEYLRIYVFTYLPTTGESSFLEMILL